MSKMKRQALEMHPCQIHQARHNSRSREDTATLICLNLLTNSNRSKTRKVAFLLPSAASITVLSAKLSKRRFQITMSPKSVSTIKIGSKRIKIVLLAVKMALRTRSASWPSFRPRFRKLVPTFASSRAKQSRKSSKNTIMWLMRPIIKSISEASTHLMTTHQIALCLTKICTVLEYLIGWEQTLPKNQSLSFSAGKINQALKQVIWPQMMFRPSSRPLSSNWILYQPWLYKEVVTSTNCCKVSWELAKVTQAFNLMRQLREDLQVQMQGVTWTQQGKEALWLA